MPNAFEQSVANRGADPWDPPAAEALANLHQGTESAPPHRQGRAGSRSAGAAHELQHPFSPIDHDSLFEAERDWLGQRFAEIAGRIKQSLAELRPRNALLELEQRFAQFQDHVDQFQRRIGSALDDVAKRSDVDGLRLIEAHISEIEGKLQAIVHQLGRFDGLEAGLRAVAEQVSDDRLALILEQGDKIAADIEAATRRASGEMLARFDELGRAVASQTSQFGEIKELLGTSITERRQGEEQAVTMLDTLQQALIRVLDRMDAIEEGQEAAVAALARPAPAAEADIAGLAEDPLAIMSPPADSPWPQSHAVEEARTTRPTAAAGLNREPERPAAKKPIAVADEPPVPAAPESPRSSIEKMRRDFIADAQRAKLKAASQQTSPRGTNSEKPANQASRETWPASQPAKAAASGPGKILGMSPKLLIAALAIVVAINLGLVLISRGHDEPAPQVGAAPSAFEAPGALPAEKGDVEGPGGSARKGLGFDTDPEAPAEQHVSADPPAPIPAGITLQHPEQPPTGAKLAKLFTQQRSAELSGRLGNTAAKASLAALLPEAADESAEPAALTRDVPAEGTARPSALDLPPATVGPLSLRLAAAKGDPSAEFEVAARLAEGKGTTQSFKDALAWYQRSASQGFAQAQYRLATFFERGLGTKADLGRARVWYQRAADQGNVKAMHNLAALAAGREDSPDYATAARWFAEAAQYGLPDSQYNLAVLHESGLGVEKDLSLAYLWFSLAAMGGDKDALRRRDEIEARLGPADIAAVKERVAGFTPKPSIAIANDARLAGEDWKKRQTDGAGG